MKWKFNGIVCFGRDDWFRPTGNVVCLQATLEGGRLGFGDVVPKIWRFFMFDFFGFFFFKIPMIPFFPGRG